MESSNRRLTLFEQMSAVDNGRNTLAALTVEAILGNAQRPQQPSTTRNRTLLEIILDDGSNKDKKSWKTLRDKLRLKRAGSAWTSSVHVPASDVNVRSDRSQLARRGSFRSHLADSARVEDENGRERALVSDPPVVNFRLQLAQRDSVRFGHNPLQTDYNNSADISMPNDVQSSRSFRTQINHHHSTRLPCLNTAINDADSSDDDSSLSCHVTRQLGAALAEERALSAREAVVAQEAAEAAAAAAAENNAPPTVAAEEPVRMSLMELLEETNRQMGLTGSSYTMGDDGDEYEEWAEEEEEVVVEPIRGIEDACCVCMVRRKGAAFIPCGHTFCRLCSRELWVQRGNCPLCNGSILEILDIF